MNLNNIKSGFNLSKINENFDRVKEMAEKQVLYRKPESGQPNQMETDLDMNGHVNNSKYLEWMCESLGYDFLLCHVPKKIQLKYIKEVAPTSQVSSRLVTTALHSQHEIVVEGHIHAQATIEWRKRDDAR